MKPVESTIVFIPFSLVCITLLVPENHKNSALLSHQSNDLPNLGLNVHPEPNRHLPRVPNLAHPVDQGRKQSLSQDQDLDHPNHLQNLCPNLRSNLVQGRVRHGQVRQGQVQLGRHQENQVAECQVVDLDQCRVQDQIGQDR